jgi:hypothetical protein
VILRDENLETRIFKVPDDTLFVFRLLSAKANAPF